MTSTLRSLSFVSLFLWWSCQSLAPTVHALPLLYTRYDDDLASLISDSTTYSVQNKIPLSLRREVKFVSIFGDTSSNKTDVAAARTSASPSSAPALFHGFDAAVASTSPSPSNAAAQALSTSSSSSPGAVASVPIGDNSDQVYSVQLAIGNMTTVVDLDTGSSDLWVVTPDCTTSACQGTNAPRFSTSSSGFVASNTSVTMKYGDSTSASQASGPVGSDLVSIGGIGIPAQQFAAVDNSTNSALTADAAGILGLGFPGESIIQGALISQQFNNPAPTGDDLISTIASNGPLLSRMVLSGQLQQPMFTISLQRENIVPTASSSNNNTGMLTIGGLPEGVDNSSLTWVPVRLYTAADGGLSPPSFAPDEVYPFRWEVPLDAVYWNGTQLPNTNLTGSAGNDSLSALIDTGNSLLRGPSDVVQMIDQSLTPGSSSPLSSASSTASTSTPIFPCATPQEIAFQIGGKMFPVNPADFVAQTSGASQCSSKLVSTDPPSAGTLFSWSLGDPFLRSTTVAFYYGNLTHPSVDPPRIGFLSTVPANASETLVEDVQEAVTKNGGTLLSVSEPTSIVSLPVTTTLATAPNLAVSATPAANNQDNGNGVTVTSTSIVQATSTSTPSGSSPSSQAKSSSSSHSGAVSMARGAPSGPLVLLGTIVVPGVAMFLSL